MSQKIEFELAANDTSAKAAWERQQKAINGVIEKLGKLEDASARQSKKQEGWLSKGTTQLAGMAAGYLSITGAISGVIQANQQMIDQADQAALKYDTLFRKINVQANTLGVGGEAGKKRVLDNAYNNASTVEESAAIAQALASSGFSAEQATGEALNAVLQAQSAMGQQGSGQGAAIAEATAKYMNAMGIEMTGENMRREMIAMQQSAKLGFAKFEDMGALSGKVGGFAGKVSSADVMAAYNLALKNSASADTASTGLKIFGDRLMGAKGDKEREGLLKKVGLDASQVDFIGEDMDTVMERLDKALQGMKEEDRAPWLQKMFGTEAAGIAQKMIEQRKEMKTFRDAMGNEAGFNADVQEMNTGPAAAARRLAVQEERLRAERESQAAQKLRAAQIADMQNGEVTASTWLSTTAANAFMGVGFTPEQAVGMAFGSETAGQAMANVEAATTGVMPAARKPAASKPATTSGEDAFHQAVMAQAGVHPLSVNAPVVDMAETNTLLKKLVANTANPPVVIRKPDVPVTPVGVRAGKPK